MLIIFFLKSKKININYIVILEVAAVLLLNIPKLNYAVPYNFLIKYFELKFSVFSFSYLLYSKLFISIK